MIPSVIRPPIGYSEALHRLEEERIIDRIWNRDHTVWSSSAEDIENRLAWLDLPSTMPAHVDALLTFMQHCRQEAFTETFLLGMGGSSLAPEMFARLFSRASSAPPLTVVDTTHPTALHEHETRIRTGNPLFIVATKSGTTTETLSLFRYAYRMMVSRQGASDAGKHFVAITDPGTRLAKLADTLGFRACFLNTPDVGGRYSALSHFGLVPAALAGLDIAQLLRSAREMATQCRPDTELAANPSVMLGAFLGAAACSGRDKATLHLPDRLMPFGHWIEQLIAESSGKDGKGILPVLEPTDVAGRSDMDRSFVAFDTPAGSLPDDSPAIRLDSTSLGDLGGQIFLWELATAIACYLIGVHPFNQPNVESAKQLARALTEEVQRTGRRPAVETCSTDDLSPLVHFLEPLASGDYIAIHAYLPPSTALSRQLDALRDLLSARYRVPVTLGYGPRFLHSTGQLHKGDAGRGRFVQLLSKHLPDLPIPDDVTDDRSSLAFGTLITAQAVGDRGALEAENRPVLTLDIAFPEVDTLQSLVRRLRTRLAP